MTDQSTPFHLLPYHANVTNGDAIAIKLGFVCYMRTTNNMQALFIPLATNLQRRTELCVLKFHFAKIAGRVRQETTRHN